MATQLGISRSRVHGACSRLVFLCRLVLLQFGADRGVPRLSSALSLIRNSFGLYCVLGSLESLLSASAFQDPLESRVGTLPFSPYKRALHSSQLESPK